MSLQRKFILAVCLVVILFGLASVIIAGTSRYNEVRDQVSKETEHIREEMIGLLEVTDTIMSERVQSSMKLLKQRGMALGEASQGDQVTVKGRTAPDLLLGGQPQANNFALVDGLTEVMGGTATLFSRDGSDYVRVSTNVIKDDGNRAIGTILAPQGKAMQAIRNKQSYFGEVDILGKPYLTGYSPIADRNGNTIGIWYVGYSADLKALDNAISGSRLLQKGFVALQDGKNQIRLHSDHLSGERIAEITANPGDDWAVNVVPFNAWGYNIIIGYSKSEEKALALNEALKQAGVVLVIGTLLVIVIAWLVRSMVGTPMKHYIDSIDQLANGEGDLTMRFDASRSDEFGHMAKGFNKLLERIQSTVGDAKKAAGELYQAAGELMKVARQSDAAVSAQTKETERVAASVQDMNRTAENVASSALEAEKHATEANRDVGQAGNKLLETIDNIEGQAQAIEQSSGVVGELVNASSDISGVLDVIRNIAEQTNLLALNAAIEAARAGEQGRGFAVVSDEVRSLASRTQSSTEEIRGMIERLQNSAGQASSQMEVNKRSALENVESARMAGNTLNEVLEAVRRISEFNSAIASSAEQQQRVADEVNQSIESIRQGGEQSAEFSQRTSEACQRLSDLARQLDQQLSQYRV